MTEEQHQTPPLELVEQWASEHFGEPVRITNTHSGPYIATKAADWRLEQVIYWFEFGYQADPNLSLKLKKTTHFKEIATVLKKAMRPQEES